MSSLWTDLDATERRRIADNILEISQRILSHLAATNNEKLNSNQEIVFKTSELLTELSLTNVQDFFVLPSANTYHNNFDSVILSKKLLQTAIGTNGKFFFLLNFYSKIFFLGLANIIYTSYSKNLGKYLSAPSSDLFISGEFDEAELNQTIISRILSLNFINAKNNHTVNSMPLLLAFHLSANEQITNIPKLKCVHWETDTLKWQSDECMLALQNQTHVLCECTIQTLESKYFAVAADILTDTNNSTIKFKTVIKKKIYFFILKLKN